MEERQHYDCLISATKMRRGRYLIYCIAFRHTEWTRSPSRVGMTTASVRISFQCNNVFFFFRIDYPGVLGHDELSLLFIIVVVVIFFDRYLRFYAFRIYHLPGVRPAAARIAYSRRYGGGFTGGPGGLDPPGLDFTLCILVFRQNLKTPKL